MPITYDPVLTGGAVMKVMNLDAGNPIPRLRTLPLDQMLNLKVAFDSGGWSTYDLLKAYATFQFSAVPFRPVPPAEPEPHHGFRVMGDYGEKSQDLGAPIHSYWYWDPYATSPPDFDPTTDTIIGVPLGLTENESVKNFCVVFTATTGYDVRPSRFYTIDTHGFAVFHSILDAESDDDFFARANDAGGIIDQAGILAKIGGPEYNFPYWAPAAFNVFSRPPSYGGYVMQTQRQPNGSVARVNVYDDVDKRINFQSGPEDIIWVLDPTTHELVHPISDPYKIEWISKYYVWSNPYSFAIFADLSTTPTDGVGHSSWICSCLYTYPEFVPSVPVHSYFSRGDFRVAMITSHADAAVEAGTVWNKWWNLLPAGTIAMAFVEPNGGIDESKVYGPSGNPIEAAPIVALNANTSGDTTAYMYGVLPGAIMTLGGLATLDHVTRFSDIPYICAVVDGTRALWLQAVGLLP